MKPKRSLKQFERDKRKAGCKVCALPEDVRQQLREASEKKIKVNVQLEWLRVEYEAHITLTELQTHRSGKHEE